MDIILKADNIHTRLFLLLEYVFTRTGGVLMKRKVVFRKYHYRECENFADYLEKMAVKGWIFKGWKLGLIFGRDSPHREIYTVEIFPEVDESDKKLELNTKDYIQDWRTAGWELVDSTRKFYIFRKIREDAIPVIAEKEKYENICRAEWDSFKNEFFMSCFIEALIFWRLFTTDFITYIFSNIFLLIFSAWNLIFLCESGLFLGFISWKIRSQKRLKKGENVFYGKRKGWVHIWIGLRSFLYYILTVIVIGVLISLIFRENNFGALIIIGAQLLFFGIMLWIRSFGEKKVLANLLCISVFLATLFACIVGISEEKRSSQAQLKEPDKILENSYSKGTLEEREIQKGILGEVIQYSISLYAVGEDGTQDSYGNRVVCYKYYSDRGWILDRIYSLYIDDEKVVIGENLREVLEVKQDPQKLETAVKFKDTVLYMTSREKLNQEQILLLCQILNHKKDSRAYIEK